MRTQAVLLAFIAIDNFGTPVMWAGLVAVALAVAARQVEGRNRQVTATGTIVAEMVIVVVSPSFIFVLGYSALFVVVAAVALLVVLAIVSLR